MRPFGVAVRTGGISESARQALSGEVDLKNTDDADLKYVNTCSRGRVNLKKSMCLSSGYDATVGCLIIRLCFPFRS